MAEEELSSGMSGPTARFAVASRDGVSVNERFQRSTDCLIFDACDDRVRFVERRTLPPLPRRDPEAVALRLSDCQHVLALMFPGALRRALNGKGIAFHEGRGAVEPRIREILSQVSAPTGTRGPGRRHDTSRTETGP